MSKKKSALFSRNEENILHKLNQKSDFQATFCKCPITQLGRKIFLKKILSIIKISQMEFLSHVSNCKKNKKLLYKIIKMLLQELKQEFDKTIQDNIQTKINKDIQSDKTRFIYRKNEISPKKDDINLKKPETQYQININRIKTKLTDLKLLNFKLKNQLSYLDIKIKLLSSSKLEKKYSKKYFYLNGNNEQFHAYNLLHDELIDKREKFKLAVKNKKIQNKEIQEMKSKVNLWKEEVALIKEDIHNEYIVTSQIIEEETKEYTDTDNGTNKNYKLKYFEGSVYY